jgi:hypothetical protein
MNRKLVEIITEQTTILLYNINTTIQTCDLDYVLCEMPVWKHLYHLLHSLDRWFINPERYDEPSFHEPNLNSLNIKSSRILTRNELIEYFNLIKIKINEYLSTLTDEMLSEKPGGCTYTRLALILGQYRHLCCHIGNINCTTIIETGKWPRVVGLDGNFTKELYEY